jgi:hypothetical protein
LCASTAARVRSPAKTRARACHSGGTAWPCGSSISTTGSGASRSGARLSDTSPPDLLSPISRCTTSRLCSAAWAAAAAAAGVDQPDETMNHFWHRQRLVTGAQGTARTRRAGRARASTSKKTSHVRASTASSRRRPRAKVVRSTWRSRHWRRRRPRQVVRKEGAQLHQLHAPFVFHARVLGRAICSVTLLLASLSAISAALHARTHTHTHKPAHASEPGHHGRRDARKA